MKLIVVIDPSVCLCSCSCISELGAMLNEPGLMALTGRKDE